MACWSTWSYLHNAATHGLKAGDVLLYYNGTAIRKRDDLKPVSEPGQPVPIDIWRDGKVTRRDLAPGKLGVVLDPRPAPEAIAANGRSRKCSSPRDRATRTSLHCRARGMRLRLAQLFKSDERPARVLLGTDASEPELDRLAASGELGKAGFIHLATHGVIDEAQPARSAVILTQTDLPDPLTQVLNHKPAFDGRLSVREIQGGWDLNAELATLSACETALGRDAGGEGFVGFTQALLISGTRSLCLSLWKVDDTATALLMQRFYANLLGRRPGPSSPMPKAEALREAKVWLRAYRRAEVLAQTAEMSSGVERGKGAESGRLPNSPQRSQPAVTMTDPKRPPTSGPRSCWPATRINASVAS